MSPRGSSDAPVGKVGDPRAQESRKGGMAQIWVGWSLAEWIVRLYLRQTQTLKSRTVIECGQIVVDWVEWAEMGLTERLGSW
jgi:hypothetical protein